MKKNEADRLRDIADVLDDQYINDTHIDSTYNQAQWFHWGAQEIRHVIISSGFRGFNDTKYDTSTTTRRNDL